MKQGPPIPRLGPREMMLTTVAIMSSKIFLGFPRVLIERDAQAAWLAALLTPLPAILGLTLLTAVMADFPGQPLTAVIRQVFPVPLALVALLFTWLYLLGLDGVLIRDFAEAALVTTLPEASTIVLLFLLLGIVGYSLYQGIEPLSRIAALFFWPLVLGLLAIYGLGAHSGSLLNLTPVFGAGPLPILRDGFLFSSAYIGLYFLLVFAPGLGAIERTRKIGLDALVWSGVIIAGAEAVSVLVFGYPVAAEFTMPLFQVARTIFFGRFFQRIEAVFTFTWMVSGGITVMGASWLILQMACEILRVEDRRPLVLPILALLFAVALLPRSFQSALRLDATARLFGAVVVLGLPVLLWLAWLWRRRRAKQ